MSTGSRIRKSAVSLGLAFAMVFSCASNVARADDGSGMSDSGYRDSAARTMLKSVDTSGVFGAATGYNLVCFGDYSNTGSDIEGKAYIGGKISLTGGFTFGVPNNSHCKTITSGDYGLVMGTKDSGTFQVNGGHTDCKALVNSKNQKEVASTNLFSAVDPWNGEDDLIKSAGIDLNPATYNGQDTSKFKKLFLQKSDFLAGLSSNGACYYDPDKNALDLSGSKDINIFSINADNVANSGKSLKEVGGFYLDTPVNSTTIINVTGKDAGLSNAGVYAATISMGPQGKVSYENIVSYSSSSLMDKERRLLWNFNKAETLQVGAISGSVLAPTASLTADGKGNYEGTLIVDNFTGKKFEGHDVPFNGKLPEDDTPILNKTAKLNDWQARTYDISLSVTAKSQLESLSIPCDIVLVLDRSGSMKDNLYSYKAISDQPDTDASYYILLNGEYTEVYCYYNSWYERYFWYYTPFWGGWVTIEPKLGGTGEPGTSGYPEYQFYTRTKQSKMAALKAAASNFVQNVSSQSPDSRIGIVSFASGASVDAELDGKQLLRAGNNDSKNELLDAIKNLRADGSTAADYAMETTKDLFNNTAAYEDVTQATPRSKAVVFFTDGEPNHSDGFDPSVAKAAVGYAADLKASPLSATVYSIGLFSDPSTEVKQFMEDIASQKEGSDTKLFYYVNDSDALNNIFQEISKEVGGFSGATVTDVIDARFRLTSDSENALKDEATITTNADGSQTIVWSQQEIDVKSDNTPGWTKKFTVVAKNDYIGGNNITTNAPGSGLSYAKDGKDRMVPFENPVVNVRPEFRIGSQSTTIFYGETAPVEPANQCKGWNNDPRVQFQWYQPDGKTALTGANTDFPAGLTPNDDTAYVLNASFDPGAPTDASTRNSNGHIAGETAPQSGSYSSLKASGTYTVNVIKGALDLTKTIDSAYPAESIVNAKQSFVFKITRRDDPNSEVKETFYEVITPDSTLSGQRAITGLKKGYYTVTEDNGTGVWRYQQKDGSPTDNDNDTPPGTVFIGRDTSAGSGVKSYFGAGHNTHGVTENHATVQFKNTLVSKRWFSDTTVAVNTITK